MNERIKLLRKEENLNQEDFGKRLGVTKTAISKMELGTYNVTDTMIKLICSEFNVNEDWLRTGEGKIRNYTDTSDIVSDHFDSMMDNASPQKKAVLSALVEMMYHYPDDKWDYVFNQFENCLQEARKGKVSSDLFEGVPETEKELEQNYPPLKIPTDDEDAG